jgi:hypothetical protein
MAAALSASPVPVASLWVSGALGMIERLSLISFLAHGHTVTLYTYDEVSGVPAGVVVRDARAVLPEERMRDLRYRSGSYALGSNLFRYEMQRQSVGMWIDADVVALRPIRLTGDVVIGRESDRYVNGAVLLLAPELPVLADAISLFDPNTIPPWVPYRKRLGAWRKRLSGRSFGPQEMPFGTFGPNALTALLRKHGLLERAQPESVFYPLAPRDARRAFDPALPLDAIVREDTLTVHLWNDKIVDLKQRPAPKGSIVYTLLSRYGVA